jgi:hypothetical protein
MKLLLISKKVVFNIELFGWFLIWQFVICKSYKKMLIVYAQATILKIDFDMHSSEVKNWAPTQRWGVSGQVCLIIGPSECRKWSWVSFHVGTLRISAVAETWLWTASHIPLNSEMWNLPSGRFRAFNFLPLIQSHNTEKNKTINIWFPREPLRTAMNDGAISPDSAALFFGFPSYQRWPVSNFYLEPGIADPTYELWLRSGLYNGSVDVLIHFV